MCDHYTNDPSWAEVQACTAQLPVAPRAPDLEPAYNIASSQNAWVVLVRDGQVVTERQRWGPVSNWGMGY